MRDWRRELEFDNSAAANRRLVEEINTLSKRLDQLGPEGDCGYEKAMIRFFSEQIALRRERLAKTLGR